MGERPVLITTTRLGVRPLGVRGEPLHAVAPQLISVIRRRLGAGAADLLAEPQMRESGDGIDWYAAWDGPVRRLADASEAERTAALAALEPQLAAIDALGGQLETSAAGDEARLVGRSLRLATRRPSDDFVYLVGDRPVIVAWGYEADSAASLAGFGVPTLPASAFRQAAMASAPALPAMIVGWAWWVRALFAGLLLLLLLLLASALLRACAPVDPALNIATLEGETPPTPPPPENPLPVLKASLDDASADEKKLRAELASLEGNLKDKVAMCKPIEPPKVVEAPKPPPPPPPPPKPAPPPPPPPQQQANAPPLNHPPPGQLPCNWAGDSGGEGITRNRHYLGPTPGFVGINYNLFARPDDIKVFYHGQQIAGTGGPRSGRGGFGFNWNPVGGDYSVDVVVTGEMYGTRWNYAMSCPR
jgi:hypothetical protein